MSSNRLVIASAAFAFLLGITIWAVRSQHTDQPSVASTVKLPKIDGASLSEIEIRRPNEAVVKLSKTGTTWQLVAPVTAQVDDGAVKSATEALTELAVKGIAATKKENHAVLEVDEAHAVRVIAKSKDKTLIDVLIGAYRGGNTMGRLYGHDEVYSLGGSLKYVFNRAPKDWRDKEVVAVPVNDLRSVHIESSKGKFLFVRDNGEWAQDKGEKKISDFDKAKVQSTATSLSQVFATDFAEPSMTRTNAGLDSPGATITLKMSSDAGPSEVVLKLGKAIGAEGYYLERVGNPVLFVVSKYLGDLMMPAADAFQAKSDKDKGSAAPSAPAAPSLGGPAGGQQIPPEIMEQLQRQMQQQQH